ncbi:Phosphoketolase, variant 2 [Balamuthia mandrillaris]
MEATPEPKRKATVGVALDVMKAAREEGEERLARLEKLVRATNYLAAAQIYLKDNVLLSEPLKREHLKERLLGHWGTCPGLNLVYAHASNLIKKHDLDMFLVVGPGHGAPSYLANIWAEGSLGKFYPDYCNNWHGLKNLISKFSWPEGFPSHVNSEMPGCIHEGGELGYALAVSFGAIMDNPDLIVACVIGDGESETGPTATAWHSYKFIDPKESGAVLPILHLNHFKIASATIYGSMTYEELNSLFTGYGYEVRFVSDLKNIHADLCASMEWAYKRIRHIQQAARQGNPIERPYWPMLVLDTPKGFTGVKELDGKKIEGNYLSHQVPVDPFSSDKAFSAVEQWLKSYQVHELFDLETGSLIKELRECFPRKERRMGMNPHTMPRFKPLDLPPLEKYACTLEGDEEEKGKDRQNEPNEKKRGKHSCGLMQQLGKYLAGVIERNPTRFRIFSPDELVSNKLEGVFEVTNRNTQWWHGLGQGETKKRDTARVIEMLSEHTCQGWMQGYCLTGRFALFPSYETFLGIITTMMMQHAKFIKLGLQTSWRPPTPSLNYIETSTLWRQEHNGFSHQNPMFSSNLINMRTQLVRVFFPPDANCCLWCMEYCLSHHNTINLVVIMLSILLLSGFGRLFFFLPHLTFFILFCLLLFCLLLFN